MLRRPDVMPERSERIAETSEPICVRVDEREFSCAFSPLSYVLRASVIAFFAAAIAAVIS